MKILLLTAYYYPRIGGVEDSVRNFARAFSTLGNKVQVITKKHDVLLKEKEIVDNIVVWRLPFISNKFFKIFNFWLWLWKHKESFGNFDIVVFNDFSSFYWYLPLKFYYRRPSVVLYYGYESFPIKLRYKILRRIAKFFTDAAFNGGKYLDRYYGFTTDYYFYPGVENVPIVNMKKKKNRIIFAGRLAFDTSIMEYLDVLRILKEKYNLKIHLDIFGDGLLRKEAEDFVENYKLDVTFHGFVSNAKRFFPDYKFAFGTQWATLMDCMRTKCLVFSFCKLPLTFDYVSEMLQEGRLGVISQSPKDMAERFYYYYTNPRETNLMLQEAYKLAKKRTWILISKDILRVFSKLINKH